MLSISYVPDIGGSRRRVEEKRRISLEEKKRIREEEESRMEFNEKLSKTRSPYAWLTLTLPALPRRQSISSPKISSFSWMFLGTEEGDG